MNKAALALGLAAVLICTMQASAHEDGAGKVKALVRDLVSKAEGAEWPDEAGVERLAGKVAELEWRLQGAEAAQSPALRGTLAELDLAARLHDLSWLREAEEEIGLVLDDPRGMPPPGAEDVDGDDGPAAVRRKPAEAIPPPALELPGLADEIIPPAALGLLDDSVLLGTPALADGAIFLEMAGPAEGEDTSAEFGVPGKVGAEEMKVVDASEAAPEAAAAGEEVPPVGVEGKPASSLLAPRGRWKCEPAPTIVKVLKPAESITLNADEVGDEQETVGIVTEHVTLELLITADGFFGTVRLSGQEEGRAAFRLAADPKKLAWSLAVGKGEGKISCWPVRGFTATADEAGLSLELESVSWAVVLQAADVGPDGLEVSCDDLTGVLYNGQRMDSRRTGEDEVVFVISGQDWSREPTPWGIAQTKREDGPRTAGEPQQAAHGPLRPWQTLFLPVIEVGVLRPEDVSP